MNFIYSLITNMTTSVANDISNRCMFLFFEPEVPKSLREE